jgi:O-antigen ligase
VWVCFAGMVAVSMLLVTRGRFANGKQRRPVAVSLGLLAVLVSFLFGALQFRAQTQAPQDTGPLLFLLHDNRIPILHATNDMMRERPWLGYGYANPDIGDSFAARLETPWLRQYVQHAHNVVLNHALQMGPMGAIVILALFAALAWVFIRRVPLAGLARLAGLCGVALVIGVFMRNMTDDFFSRHTAQFFGAALGMLLGLGTHRPPLNMRNTAQRKNT